MTDYRPLAEERGTIGVRLDLLTFPWGIFRG